jgi:ATP-binding cassette subfamily F protein uup
LVTHDHYLLDRVTNTVIGLDGRGNAEAFADYRQWEAWRNGQMGSVRDKSESLQARPVRTENEPAAPAASRKKLSYLEQREYDGIETRVAAADARLETARNRIEDPAVAIDAAALTQALEELESAQNEHDLIYERWAELADKAER